MKCPHCFQLSQEDQPRTIARDRLESILSWFVEQNQGQPASIQYFGGEPLLHIELLAFSNEILQAAVARNALASCQQSLTTNATLLGGEEACFLVHAGIDATVSLDGWEEDNDRYRIFKDGSGTFDAAMQGVRNLERAGGKASVLITVHPDSVEQLPRTIERFVREGIFSSIGVNAPQPTASGWEVDGDELARAIQQSWLICQDARIPFHGPGTQIPQIIRTRRPASDRCIDASAREGVADWPLYVSPDGQISYCLVHHHDERCGQPAMPPDPGRLQCWHLDTRNDPGCDQCIACLVCGGPCSLELLLRDGRLNPDRCAFYKRMTPWILEQ